MNSRKMEVSVIIPAFNEESRIESVIREARPYADEVIVINDCSTDNTAQIARKMGAKVLSHRENRGHKEAVKTGFSFATREIIVTLDADGEYPADQLLKLVQPIREGKADLVSGTRQTIPRFSERVITSLARLNLEVTDTGAGFKAIRTSLARKLELHGFCICGVFLLEADRKGGEILEVPVKQRKIQKEKKPAWHHLPQCLYVLRELILSLPSSF